MISSDGPRGNIGPAAQSHRYGADTTVKKALNLLAATYKVWSDRAAMRLGAAVAFYAIFSITPLILSRPNPPRSVSIDPSRQGTVGSRVTVMR